LLRHRRRQVARPLWHLRRCRRQVARPLSSTSVTFGEPTLGGSVVVGLRSMDLPMALSSPALGRRTSLQLHCCPHQVARPFSGSIVVFSLDLPPVSRFHCRLLARPSSGFVIIIIIRLLDPLPALSLSLPIWKTSLRHRRRFHQFGRPTQRLRSSSSKSLYNFVFYVLVDGCTPTAWLEFYSAAS
jgi:hypothetical protein